MSRAVSHDAGHARPGDPFRAMCALLDQLVALLDSEGRLLEINDAGCDLLQRARAQLIGCALLPLLAKGAERTQLEEALRLSLSVPQAQSVEAWLEGGAVRRRIRWRFAAFDDAARRGVLLSASDVSEAQLARDALDMSKARFRAFMDNSPLIAGIKDRDGVVRYANPAWGRRLGLAPRDMIGRSERELFGEERVHRFRQTDARVFEDGETVELTEQGSVIDGEQSWWRVLKFPIDDEHGERRLGLFAWEVTDRVRIQTALAASEAHAKAVLDTAVDAIVTIDTAGVVTSFNRAASHMFGYTASEVIGHNVKMLMPPPYRDEHDLYLENYLLTGDARIIGIGREVSARRKDATVFPIELAVSEVFAGVEHGFTAIIKDLTEKKRTEAQLREREEEARYQQQRLTHLTRLNMLGEMAAGIAHEVNQPLSAIASYAQACRRLVADGSGDHSALLETLDKVQAQARRAGDIIRRVRGLVRKGEGEQHPQEINAVLRESLQLVEQECRLAQIRIETSLAPALPHVTMDRVQIQQVVLNLLRNAIEAVSSNPREPCITVSSHRDEPAVRVCVADNGPGMDADTAARVFDHFFTTKQSGMGIGLAISQSIVVAHGGRMWLEQPAHGACVCFTLPLEPARD